MINAFEMSHHLVDHFCRTFVSENVDWMKWLSFSLLGHDLADEPSSSL